MVYPELWRFLPVDLSKGTIPDLHRHYFTSLDAYDFHYDGATQ